MAANMNPPNQFGSAKPVRSGEGMTCVECEAMLMDAIDGTLSMKDKVAFELHIATCAECSQMLADAKRGAALLEMLKSPRPEPSAALLERILIQTSGLAGPAKSQTAGLTIVPPLETQSVATTTVSSALLASDVAATKVLPFRPAAGKFSLRTITHTMMQPRMAMTAAMAFFSIALTLNLTGVRLTELRVSDLKPSSLKHSFYQADASVVRYYDNLRVVYELESRVRDLRSSDSDSPASTGSAEKSGAKDSSNKTKSSGSGNDQKDQHKTAPKAGSGTSQRGNPLQQEFRLAVERDYGSHGPTTESTELIFPRFAATGFVTRSDKSKEELQEGGSV